MMSMMPPRHPSSSIQQQPKRRVFRTVYIFQLLGTLIFCGLMISIWLMVQLEVSYKNIVIENPGGVVLKKHGRRRMASSTEIRISVDDDDNMSEQQKQNYFSVGDGATIDRSHHHLLSKPRSSNNNTHIISSMSNTSFPPLPPSLDYLGVLIDAGRHYFPLRWLYEHLRHLHNMGYNYIHFRLTDDQNFVLNLTIPSSSTVNHDDATVGNGGGTSFAFTARHENLAGSSSSSNNGGNGNVYQPNELSEFVRFAKENYNITVIPEVNIPGHAGAWGANKDYPDLVISCPEFVCSKGYGVPLNVSHTELPRILKYVLKQVVEIFDYPPFLHLGGDELHMSTPCLEEAGIIDPISWLTETVPYFEEYVLRPIVEELGYGPHQILQWETRTSHKQRRFGGITHYWESTPSSSYDPYAVSTGLYLDVVGTDRRYGYWDYLAAQKLVTDLHLNPPFAIVVGTFELNMEFWKDRNVLGRLLAIRMGVSSPIATTSITTTSMDQQRRVVQKQVVDVAVPSTSMEDFRRQYIVKCNSIFHFSKYDAMCQKSGWPLLDDRNYRNKWTWVWKQWKDGLCSGLTYSEQTVHIKKSAVDDVGLLQREANYYYWDRILSSPAPSDSLFSGAVSRSLDRNPTIAAESATSIIPNVGILVDLVQDPLSQQGFQELLQTIQPLGFNLIQLRVTDDFGQVIDYDSIQNVAYHHTSSQINKSNGKNPIAYKYYGRHPLEKMVEWANKVGIQLVPEINLATNGGGWYKTGLLMDCPITLCSSMKQGVAFDVIDKIESVIPIVTAAILELRDIFSLSSSRQFLHLGSDQRERAIKGCFLEAGHTVSESHAALRRFEGKLTTALSMIGIDQNQIIRWHNQENIQYPDRTGNITHYTDISDIVNDESNSSFFGTVHLTNEMTPMEVYLATRRWTMKSPTPHGIVAKAINGQTPKLTHLAAFTIGLRRTENELLPITEEEFQREFDALCERLHCADKEPVVRATNNRPPPAALSLIESCVERTTNVTTKRSRAFLPSSRREQLYQ